MGNGVVISMTIALLSENLLIILLDLDILSSYLMLHMLFFHHMHC